MHYVISQNRYGHIGYRTFNNLPSDALESIFKTDFRNRFGLYYLMKQVTLSRVVNKHLLDSILKEVGIYAIHINCTYDFNQLILKYYEQFWLQVQAKRPHSRIYAESIWASYPGLYQAFHGKHIALISSHQETMVFNDAFEIFKQNQYRIYIKQNLVSHTESYDRTIKYIRDLLAD